MTQPWAGMLLLRRKVVGLDGDGGIPAPAPTPSRRIMPSEEDLLEGEPELGAEDGVDDWVEGGVEVAEPEEDRCDHVREPV